MKISLRELAGPLFQPMGQLKSTQDKIQRRENMENQVAALKERQAGLKNRECDTLESIAEKLELYHSYESEIAAVKKAYNMAEMTHAMDEAIEQGEQIAEAAEKLEPKTEEERRREALEEATGTEESLLAKLLEENPLAEEELADDFSFQENWERIREELEKVRPAELEYSYMQMLSDACAKHKEEYRGDDSFEDSVTLMAKAYQEVYDHIDEAFDETSDESVYDLGENGKAVEPTREQCMEALAKTYEHYVTFASVSKRIMTEIRQKFHGEHIQIDAYEVQECTRQAYMDAISDENLNRLREKKDSVSDYRLSFSVEPRWLKILTQIR